MSAWFHYAGLNTNTIILPHLEFLFQHLYIHKNYGDYLKSTMIILQLKAE